MRGRLIDLIEARDRDRIVGGWLAVRDNIVLARVIADHIVERFSPDEGEIRLYLERTVRNFHRDLAMAVIILVEASLVNQKLDASSNTQALRGSYSMSITAIRNQLLPDP